MQTPAQSPEARPARWWRVALFAAGVLAISTLASFGIDSQESPAALLFVLSPFLVAAALRWTGDGWRDAGLRWRSREVSGRSAGAWYLVAAAMFPVLLLAVMGAGVAFGAVEVVNAQAGLVAFATFVVPVFIYCIGEEFGWRGYAEPRLANLGVSVVPRRILIGLVWGVWHLPYILALGDDYTTRHLGVFLPLFLASTVAMSFLWGLLRDRTGSVWPAVVAHAFANATAYALLDSDVVVIDNPDVWAGRPEALVMFVLLVVAAVWSHLTWGRTSRGGVARRGSV